MGMEKTKTYLLSQIASHPQNFIRIDDSLAQHSQKFIGKDIYIYFFI